jgi:hypothetical protein
VHACRLFAPDCALRFCTTNGDVEGTAGNVFVSGSSLTKFLSYQLSSMYIRFFLAEHQTKKTLSCLLRSIDWQAALSYDAFLARVLELHKNAGILFGQ